VFAQYSYYMYVFDSDSENKLFYIFLNFQSSLVNGFCSDFILCYNHPSREVFKLPSQYIYICFLNNIIKLNVKRKKYIQIGGIDDRW